MEAKSQVESGAVDCGDSDEDQTHEVSFLSGSWYCRCNLLFFMGLSCNKQSAMM